MISRIGLLVSQSDRESIGVAAAIRFCEAGIWWAANRDAAALSEFFETGDAQIAHVLATIRALRRIGALLFMT